MGEAFSIIRAIMGAVGLALLLLILPGWGLLRWAWRNQPLSWGEEVGLAASLSLALYPIVTLWFYQLGLQPGPWVGWGLGVVGLALWLWSHRQPSLRSPAGSWWDWQYAPNYTLAVLIAALVITRLLPIQAMVAPAWGDSVHHTVIVQLILDHGGLFQSWAPYAPLATFSYHFGFHTVMASWAWSSGTDAAQAVLVGAQMLNVVAVLALYPLAVRLAGGNRWAGVVAVLAAGLLFQTPAFYVNWGRYTQLAGQAILPGLLWTFDLWWTEKMRPTRRLLVLVVCLGAGLVLTHYRIAAIAGAAGFAWALWALWQYRRQPREWIQRTLWSVGAAVLIALIVLPWGLVIRSARLPYVAGVVAQQGLDPALAQGDLVAWGTADLFYTRFGWLVAVSALLLALLRRPKVAVVLGLWCLFTFLVTNPYLLGLPGSGLVNNFTLVIGAYLPIALALGWLAAEGERLLPATTTVRLTLLVLVALLIGYGVRQQVQIVDPFFQMVTPADERALAWVEQNTPVDARFLVNGFLAYGDTVVVGSDAGWWLPYYTRRATTVPPISYTTELLNPDVDRQALRQLIIDLDASQGEPAALQRILCQAEITHLYLGDRQGQVGYGATPSIPVAWLVDNRDFERLHQEGQAQVWAFERGVCSGG
jgi:hypothetical protein